MDVLSLISTKGGAGKTTVAANLGGVLADASLRVLLLDLDSQPTLSSYYALTDSREAGSFELIAQRLTAHEQIISTTAIQHLDLIISNDRAGHISTLLLHAADGRLRLRNLLPAFEEQYDVLIIDTQGARSVVVEMVILASDCALCPVPPEMLAARELRRGTLGLFEELEPYRYLDIALPTVKLLLNQVNANRRDTRLIMQSLQASFQADPHVSVCNTVILDRVAYPNAASLGLPVHRVEATAPHGSSSPCAAEVMRGLARELFPQWTEQINALATPTPCRPANAERRLIRRG
ncbi:ParA family protein [Pseudomonas guariconensis]|uniref:ParA family protein n=1 Tax=Pseudomonas guariconensis TaxID=1288410 RepID=UPI0018AC844D|nr:ParA family protein [Pseudomonas guariconensis]MBF8740709.1 ParA family protein [Pseudomonas guariconensis]MBF8749889.1 ParA family protein [Pseudomonas guariconensis]